RIDEGLAQIESGIAAYEGLRTPPVFWPLLLFIKAIGRGLGGRPTDGLRLLEEAMGIVGQDHLLYPDFALLRGDLLLGSGDVEGAVPSFLRAFDVAQSLGLRTPELRAATRLSRVGRTDGTELLREVYETFTEGHDAPDLVDARAVLDAMQVSE